jgi:hypothetical protein
VSAYDTEKNRHAPKGETALAQQSKNRTDPFLKKQVAKFEKSLSFGNECEKLSIVS